jgi:hypothetical protein
MGGKANVYDVLNFLGPLAPYSYCAAWGGVIRPGLDILKVRLKIAA